MIEIEYRSELSYQVQTNCEDDGDGFRVLEPLIKSLTTFFDLLGAELVYKEFWSTAEGQKFYSRIEGYNITVVFYGQGSTIYRFIMAASLFFDLHNAVKVGEELYFVKKDSHD